MMLSAVLPHVVKNAKFDYFDIIALCWLMIGMWWGRKRGMSQEVLPLLQWLGILAAGGLLYAPFGLAIHNSIRFSMLWADITAYLLIAMGVHLMDNLDLESLAAACAEERRWDFLLTVAPLVLRRGTASPVNPIAVF